MSHVSLQVNHYRLSLSWPRIVPNPLTGDVNQLGIDYYNRVIDALIEAGITPMVTLYHWDLPDILETECGGWLNESLVEYFNHYADVSFGAFGDRVRTRLFSHTNYSLMMLIPNIFF